MAIEIPGWIVQLFIALVRQLPRPASKALRLKVREVRAKKFKAEDGTVVYTMLQLWVANESGVDAQKVRATLDWKRRGSGALQGHWRTDGLWMKKLASGLASYPGGVTEDVDLLSNGDEQHLGLVAKPPSSVSGFIVSPRSYYAGPQHPNYQHPDFALPPGIYDVDIEFRGIGGRKGAIRLEVHQPGAGGDPFGGIR